ncbi:hypothetical protein PIN31115_03114 [Pandoraea iniqua]|uniref:Uncharacterized protein n=1 Tax=Pandoraea iniqua TaxID=2508288 RepID=A0A5E4WBD8_9BURK|nr:hypothetical protein PIN31115_03114 [Pandoraea iniqua]
MHLWEFSEGMCPEAAADYRREKQNARESDLTGVGYNVVRRLSA